MSINPRRCFLSLSPHSQWAHKYHELTGAKINYQSIGSGGGIAQIKAKTVDFGASDEPLKVEDLDQAGLVQFPMVVGGVVPVVNVAGITAGQRSSFTGDLLAQVFMGENRQRNDPAIKNLNPGLNLPDLNITIVHRADGSGTTWLFTHFLGLSSPEWQEKVGGQIGQGPAPNSVGAKRNEAWRATKRTAPPVLLNRAASLCKTR